ncbi:endolytic transglycosylase MltG [Jeotgalibacillus soli]|uniref:Endolytic murein transglycosylase n=1 Tax=Jeotgalibacillus soli TaxID=889306 RepID=A0A0C2VKK4_9BACL|nr:endolytic transglycosylase MltG [Jeotgalibacillus soli]KIL44493.1 hypothetical protein KP78_34570 [Jeotgalibacillus soli]
MSDNQSKIEQWIHNLQERKKEAKLVRKIVFISMIVFLLVVVGVGFGGYTYISSSLEPADPEDNTAVSVEIPIGSSVDSIVSILEENNIVRDATVFKYYLKFNNESDFQAGTYDLTPSMTLGEITESLKTGRVYHEPLFMVTVPEGLSLEEIAVIIEENTRFTADEFMTTVDNPEFINSMKEKYPELVTDSIFGESIQHPLEGYLFPATYPFYDEDQELEEIISQMVEATYVNVTPYIEQYAETMQNEELTVHDVLTFASLLEEEATEDTDRRLIASVFYNRLEEGMPLQTDPTVLYALGEWSDRVLFEDLEVDSPYNTYKNTGLPPGPIASSGVSSIEAVLNPENSNYFYFLASLEDGTVYYSETLDEHERKAEEYIYNEREEAETEE